MEEIKLTGESKDILNENIQTLKELFPEIVSEDKIDFDMFKSIFGGEIDDSSERYSFTWPGKTEAIKESQKQSTGTLRPCKEESKDWDTTKNLYIKGDNLEVLKLLQKGYHQKVKTIIIDPPYNTGNDFIYPDNYQDNLENYLKISGQVSDSEEGCEAGIKVSTNTETSGRYHSKWLNMMYPRLKLARNLLRDDGCIFVFIDYNEVNNLKKIMDEIFGESNFQREIIWRIGWLSGYKTTAPNFIRNHDTILFYSKNNENLDFIKKYVLNEEFKPLVKPNPNLNSKLASLGLSKAQIKDLYNFINYENRPEKYPIEDTWNCNEYDDLNSIAIVSFSGEKISKILDINQDFKGQKSTEMLKRLLVSTTKENDIVLDFFSGTSSTAHSVIKLNAEDGGNRRFIMVQIPELLEEDSEAFKEGYETICEIAKERIRRAGDKIINEAGNKNLDIGFKVFSLGSSNLNKWDPDYEDLEQTLLVAKDNIKDDRTQEDLIYEIMLKYGIDLTLPIEEYNVGENKIYSIGFGALLICLDDNITKDIADSILELSKDSEITRVVFKDNGFASDADKTNIKETLRTHHIDEFITI